MKKYRRLSAAMIAVLLSITVTTPLSALAFAPDRSEAAGLRNTAASSSDADSGDDEATGDGDFEDNEAPGDGDFEDDEMPDEDESEDGEATDGDALEEESEELSPASPSSLLMAAPPMDGYTFCGYDFFYADRPLELELGAGLDEYTWFPETVDLYLDGPDGHIDEGFELEVEWDLSVVDFDKAGSYTIIGQTDSDDLPYPLDWDQIPPPSFTLEVVEGGVLSFQYRFEQDRLSLDFIMNGVPFALSERIITLYESRDGGKNWYDITPSSRVQFSKTGFTVKDIRSDALFQATGLNLGGFYRPNSDFVEVNVNAGSGIASVSVLSSEGFEWDDPEATWHDYTFSEKDGPFQILRYMAGPNPHIPLEVQAVQGRPETLRRDFFSTVTIFFGNQTDGFWSEKLETPVPVQWDWEQIDCERTGETVLYGTFSDETKEQYQTLLNFEAMPIPTLTVTVIPDLQIDQFLMEADWNQTLKDQTAYFHFYKGYSEDLAFEDLSDLTVWCSYDSGLNWYDITEFPNVELNADSLSVSHLKDSILRGTGYSFQVEQKSRTDITPFSTALTIEHRPDGIMIGFPSSGERGGGKRWPKPPDNLFDGIETEAPDDGPDPPVTEPDFPDGEVPPPVNQPDAPDNRGGASNDGGSGSGSGNKHSSSNGRNNGNGSSSGSAAQTPEETGSDAVPLDTFPLFAAQDSVPSLSDLRPSESETDPALPAQNVERAATAEGLISPKPAQKAAAVAPPVTDSTNEAAAAAHAAEPEEADKLALVKLAVGSAALISGGLAGFWMIRRR